VYFALNIVLFCDNISTFLFLSIFFALALLLEWSFYISAWRRATLIRVSLSTNKIALIPELPAILYTG